MGSIIQLRSRTASTGDTQAEYDNASQETIARFAACVFDEDFLGAGHGATLPAMGSPVAGYPWVAKIVGAGPPTVTPPTNQPGGVMGITLAATSEKEDAALTWNDTRTWDVTKSAGYECRMAMHVLPSVAGVEMVWGLGNVWIDGPDNQASYLRFQANGSGLVNMQMFDGTTTKSVATSLTTVVDAYHNYRIDCTDPTNICFFIDGVQQNTPGQFNFAGTGSLALLQPYQSCYKASGTGVGTMYLDSVQVSMNRS